MSSYKDVSICEENGLPLPSCQNNADDLQLEAVNAKIKEDKEEIEKLNQLQREVAKQMNLGSLPDSTAPLAMSLKDKTEADKRSVYVANVDYGATEEELRTHFHGCGFINRVTIVCNKFNGRPKGCAYVEFSDQDSVATAKIMDDSLFRGRQIKVSCKRTNLPGISTTNRRFRGATTRGGYHRGGYGAMRGPKRGANFTPYPQNVYRWKNPAAAAAQSSRVPVDLGSAAVQDLDNVKNSTS